MATLDDGFLTKAGGFEDLAAGEERSRRRDRGSSELSPSGLGPERAAEVLGDYSLQITIHETKFTASEAAADRSLDVFNFKRVIAAGDFKNVANIAVPIRAHIVDAAGNTQLSRSIPPPPTSRRYEDTA